MPWWFLIHWLNPSKEMPLHIQYTCKANSKQLINSIFTLLSIQFFQLLWYSVHSEHLDLILMFSSVCWPNITKVTTSEQPFEPKTKYCCCLGFSFFMTDWLFPWNTITPQTYFCYSQLSQFQSRVSWLLYIGLLISTKNIIKHELKYNV